MANWGRGVGWKDGQKDGCLEIHPCVQQNIGPLRQLPKKEEEEKEMGEGE